MRQFRLEDVITFVRKELNYYGDIHEVRSGKNFVKIQITFNKKDYVNLTFYNTNVQVVAFGSWQNLIEDIEKIKADWKEFSKTHITHKINFEKEQDMAEFSSVFEF